MSSTPPCLWCSSPSTKLCDTLLRRPALEVIGCTESREVMSYPVLDLEVTCDAPMCNEHAEELTTITMCSRDDDDEPCEPCTDTLDACPYCVDHPQTSIKHSANAYRALVREYAS